MAFNFGIPKTTGGTFTLTPAVSTTAISMPTSVGIGGAGGDAKELAVKPGFFSLPTCTTSVPTFSFGSNTQFSMPNLPPLGLTTTVASAPTTAPTAAATGPQFSFGSNVTKTTTGTTSIPQFNIASTAVTTSAVTNTTSSTSFMPIASTATAVPSLFSTALTTTPTTSSSIITTSAPVVTSVATSVPTIQQSTTISTPPTLTYAQIEDSINKWTGELEDQGKFFLNQARQLNAWDSLLVTNGDKLLSLNETIEKVKQQQKHLNQDLDFIVGQQNELDDLCTSLEKQLSETTITDQSRYQMYQMSEVLDSQMKQMSDDLKEIVERLNENNKSEDLSDPVVQVGRILNAHMNLLQSVDRDSSQIMTHLDQASKLTATKNMDIK